MDDEDGGGKLPGSFEVRWIGNVKLTRVTFLDGKLTFFDGSEQVEAAAILEIGEEDIDDGFPDAGVLPLMVAGIAGLPGNGIGRKVVPGAVGGELEKDELEDWAGSMGRTAAGGGREERCEKGPLGIGKKHRQSGN